MGFQVQTIEKTKNWLNETSYRFTCKSLHRGCFGEMDELVIVCEKSDLLLTKTVCLCLYYNNQRMLGLASLISTPSSPSTQFITQTEVTQTSKFRVVKTVYVP